MGVTTRSGMPWLVRGLVLSWTALATAQTLTPTNFTNGTTALQNENSIELTLDAQTNEGVGYWMTGLLNMTDVPLNRSIQGSTMLLNYTNAGSAQSTPGIAYISCDPPSGNIPPSTVLNEAIGNGPLAVVLYSQHADYCNLTDPPDFPYIYTLRSANSSSRVLKIVDDYGGGNPAEIWSYIAPEGLAGISSDVANGTSPGGSGSIGTPTTKIAMIVLYTITGIITVLFLAIIVTGAVRAHRHPERYGLRVSAGGRPRRSRAHGLARAMLDSLPIVKFGEREGDVPKPAEVELGHTNPTPAHGPVEVLASTSLAPLDTTATAADPSKPGPDPHTSSAVSPLTPAEPSAREEAGISPATASHPLSSSADTQGCSICTDDFELGQDQRVLPCNHRFHPACVDPWLLNVSGTCPLCRIDLHGSSSSNNNNNNNNNRRGSNASVSDAEGDLAPPLALDARDRDPHARHRLSIRRSIMIGLMGSAAGADRRPENLSREERLLALRTLRGRMRERRDREEREGVGPTEEERGRIGARIRGFFGRRNGEE